VCVGVSDSKTASDDPSSSSLCVVCARCFPRGVLGGAGMPPRWLCAQCPEIVFGRFLLFLAVF
jgi:hypothetical protein